MAETDRVVAVATALSCGGCREFQRVQTSA